MTYHPVPPRLSQIQLPATLIHFVSCPTLALCNSPAEPPTVTPAAETKAAPSSPKKAAAPKATAAAVPAAKAVPAKAAAPAATASKTKTSSSAAGSASAGAASGASKAEIHKLIAKIADLEEELSLQKLDTELATEEREYYREQLEDLQLGGGGGGGDGGSAGPGAAGSAEETAALKNAVVKLRDAYQYTKEELDIIKADHKRDLKELNALRGSSSDARRAVQDNKGLSKQLDSIADSSAIIEVLTLKNEALENKASSLQEEIEELVNLVKVNEELAAAYIKYEEESSSELDAANDTVEEMQRVMVNLQAQNKQYAAAVPKFRRQVAELEAAQVVSDTGVSGEAGAAGGGTGAGSAEDAKKISELTAKLTSNAKKERAAAIDNELRLVERKTGEDALELVKLFMPDSFFNTDYAGIELVLFLRRVGLKCAVVLETLSAQYNLDQGIAGLLAPEEGGFTVDQLSFAYSVVGTITSIKTSTNFLLTGLEKGDEATYKALSTKYPEVQPHEGSIDEVLELIRKDELGNTEGIDRLKMAFRQIEALSTAHLEQTDAIESVDFAKEVLASLDVYNKGLTIELARLKEMFSRTTSEGEKDPAFDGMIGQLASWTVASSDTEKLLKKAKAALRSPDETKKLRFTPEIRATLAKTVVDVRELADRLRGTCSTVWDHTHSGPTLRAMSLDSAMKMAVKGRVDLSENGDATQKALAANAEANMVPMHAKDIVTGLTTTLAALHDSLEHGAYDVAAAAADGQEDVLPPWQARGNSVKTEISESLNYKKRLEDKEHELLEEQKKSARKTREISLLTVKNSNKTKEARTWRDQLESSNQQTTGRVNELEAELAQKNDENERVAEQQDTEIRDLDKQVKDLKKKYEGGRAGGLSGVADLRGARVEICSLKEALRVVQTEASQLRGAESHRLLEALPRLPRIPVGGMSKPMEVATAVRSMLQDLKLTAAAPMVVDITRKSMIAAAATKPLPAPAVQLARRAAALHALCTKASQMCDKANEVFGAERAGAQTGAKFGSFATPAFKRAMGEASGGYRAAIIKIPGSAAGAAPVMRKLNVSELQLKALHSEFLR